MSKKRGSYQMQKAKRLFFVIKLLSTFILCINSVRVKINPQYQTSTFLNSLKRLS